VRFDCGQQVLSAAVVQEKDTLPEAPERRGAELVSACTALPDVVSQPCSHMVNLDIAEQVGVGVTRLGVNRDGDVVRLAVWQTAQPTAVNRPRPLAIDAAPPGVVSDGVGGARRRMNIANCTVSLSVPIEVVLKFV